MSVSAPISNNIDVALPTTPEQVDDPKVFNEFMLVYRAIKALQASAANALASLTTVPVGTIIVFAGTTAPAGYLICPLSVTNISRTTYAALFAAIGTTWGAGDGSTTFGMPYVPADQVLVQANGNVGTATVGQNLAHTHGLHTINQGPLAGYNSITSTSIAPANSAPATQSSGGAANLAAGVRVQYCVKY